MSNRRRAGRYIFPDRAQATLRLMQGVFVEREDANEVVIVVDGALAPNEEGLLEVPTGDGQRLALGVSTRHCTLVPFADSLRYRATLRVTSPSASPLDESSAARSGVETPAGMGVLVRRIPLGVVDVSAVGCLLECDVSLPEGAVGILELPTDDPHTVEPVRINRLVELVGGASRWYAGAEFLPFNAPLPMSVRNTLARLEVMMELEGAINSVPISDIVVIE